MRVAGSASYIPVTDILKLKINQCENSKFFGSGKYCYIIRCIQLYNQVICLTLSIIVYNIHICHGYMTSKPSIYNFEYIGFCHVTLFMLYTKSIYYI